MRKWKLQIGMACGLCIVFALVLQKADYSFIGLWFTPGQQYQHLFDKGEYRDAAERAEDPMQQGAALYMDGRFKESAVIFGSLFSPAALFNRGNSLLMQGLYDDAISSYERALLKRPDWREAIENISLAQSRKEKLGPPDDDYGGTGGKLEADEIVIGDRINQNSSPQTDEEDDQGQLSENEQRALWLRKVQTRPADFLRIKFAHQLNQGD